MRCLIIGCGYLGQRVAALLLADGHEVCALTRSVTNAEKLQSLGVSPIVGDVMQPDSLKFPPVDAVTYAVGMDRSSGYSKRQVYVDGLRNVLNRIQTTEKFIYVSSTAVYGQADGEWVDESSATEPVSEGGRICLEAEQAVRSVYPAATIVRLAGIYGPERLLRAVDSLRAEQPIAGNPDAYLNLIHVDDAAELVRCVVQSAIAPDYLLGADGNPTTRHEYYSELARIVDAPAPVFDSTLPTRNSASGLNKRCRSKELSGLDGFELVYPSVAAGLPHAVEHSEF
ncbi:MAG: SDR family oxidoreductase [Planctomycetaceae bacterium]